MNIDLLFTSEGESGLIASENLFKKAAGIVFDPDTGNLTIEYVDMDFIELNIPVESEFNATLDATSAIHIGAVKDGAIGQAYQVPFMLLNDPYRTNALAAGVESQIRNPLAAFDYFVKQAVFGQPVHREDLGDEDAMGCILGDASPSSLQFAPHLARRHQMEIAPSAAPRGPAGPSGPGGVGGGGGGVSTKGTGSTIPPKRTDDR